MVKLNPKGFNQYIMLKDLIVILPKVDRYMTRVHCSYCEQGFAYINDEFIPYHLNGYICSDCTMQFGRHNCPHKFIYRDEKFEEIAYCKYCNTGIWFTHVIERFLGDALVSIKCLDPFTYENYVFEVKPNSVSIEKFTMLREKFGLWRYYMNSNDTVWLMSWKFKNLEGELDEQYQCTNKSWTDKFNDV